MVVVLFCSANVNSYARVCFSNLLCMCGGTHASTGGVVAVPLLQQLQSPLGTFVKVHPVVLAS